MNGFDRIPNKRPADPHRAIQNVWPELGDKFALNKFYRHYDDAEGWLGDGYFAVWTPKELQCFREPNLEAYPDNFHFFASDGGGTQFGFLVDNDQVSFLSAPDIGSEEDVRILGDWEQFLNSIETGDYI